MRKLQPLLLCAIAAAVSCTDEPLPTEPMAPQAAEIASATGEHFRFLPPIGAGGDAGGEFHPGLPVTVETCSSAGESCPESDVVARFTRDTGPGSETVRVDEDDELYIVNWHATSAAAGADYRIHVRVGSLQLGHADVRVVASAPLLRQVPDGMYGVVSNQTVPIKFRIAQGFLDAGVVSPESGGTVESADGVVTIEVPGGAVGEETVITAERLDNVDDPHQRVIPGTALELGPDGLVFDEPVRLTVRYDPANLPAGVSGAILRLHTYADGAWHIIDGGTSDPATQTVSAEISHFSEYAVLPAGFTAVTAGETHGCGLTSAGEAWCWGGNHAGQLGAASTETCLDSLPCSTTALRVDTDLTFTQIEAGTSHTCGLTAAGEIHCWGANGNGQLGTGSTAASTVPARVTGGHVFTDVTAESSQTCGLTAGAAVYCWGSDSNGRLGVTTTETCGASSLPCSTVPLHVAALPPASDVDMGLIHGCALSTTGDVYCWGFNVFGQVGTGARSGSEPPTFVGSGYASISAGAVNSCAITTAGAGYCWGSNFDTGVLGDGSNALQPAPTPVAGGLTFDVLVASNGNYIFTHSCGVTTTMRAYCWGANFDGQLGVALAPSTCNLGFGGDYDCALTPVAVETALSFLYVTPGRGFTCGYATDGAAYCWGLNTRGELGNGTMTSTRSPTRVLTAAAGGPVVE